MKLDPDGDPTTTWFVCANGSPKPPARAARGAETLPVVCPTISAFRAGLLAIPSVTCMPLCQNVPPKPFLHSGESPHGAVGDWAHGGTWVHDRRRSQPGASQRGAASVVQVQSLCFAPKRVPPQRQREGPHQQNQLVGSLSERHARFKRQANLKSISLDIVNALFSVLSVSFLYQLLYWVMHYGYG